MDEESARRRNIAEQQRIEQDLRYKRMQQNMRIMQLVQQERRHRQDNDWRMRQLEAEQY